MNDELREKVEKELTSVYDEWQDGSPWSYVVEIMADAILALFASSLVNARREAFESGYIKGHNDTAESKYREPADAAEDYRLALTAHTEAGEWRGPWKCERCEVTWDTKPDDHQWFDVPCGPVVPYERRALTRPAEQQEVAALRNEGDFLAIAAERDDLRRKLEEAQREPYQILWRALRDAGITRADGCPDSILIEEIESRDAKLSASSLANAALRTALSELCISVRGLAADLKGNVAGCERLSNALLQADATAALPADGLAQEAVFSEGSDGEWTCSGCGRDWYIEAETPEANEYLHCPGCGRRIGSYKQCEDDLGEDEATP